MYAHLIRAICNKYRPEELLDYGCGKQALRGALKIKEGYIGYDPALKGLDTPPNPADLVVCTDVLEHIEPDHLEGVLNDLQRVVKMVGFFAIHTSAAMHILPDGRNAHLIQEPLEWWLPKLMARFKVITLERSENGFWIVLEKK